MDTPGVVTKKTKEETLTHFFKAICKKYICLAKSSWKFMDKIYNERFRRIL